MPDDNGNIDLDRIETMTDDELDKLAESVLGVGDDEDDEGKAKGDEPKDDATRSEGGESQSSSEAQVAAPKGKALLEAVTSDPEAKRLIEQQLQNWLREASASADAKKQQEEFNKLVEEGNYEEIGRRFITEQRQQAVNSAAQQEGLKKAYTQIYKGLFDELEKLDLTDDDKQAIDPTKFGEDEDAAYILHLTNFINTKKSGSSVEDMAQKRAQEILEALANKKAAAAAASGSVGSLPGAVAEPANRNESSRSLIADGYRDEYNAIADQRVLTP